MKAVMRRRGTWYVGLIIIGILAASCGTGAESESTTSTLGDGVTETTQQDVTTTVEGQAATTTSAGPQEVETVSIAVETFVLHETIFGFMQSFCPENGYPIEVEPVLGSSRYLDRIVLLQQGDVDLAASGYSTIPVIVEQDLPVVTIAGTNLGATDLIVAPEIEVSDWADLQGLTIGGPTGSITTHHILIGMEDRGLDPDSVELVSMVPGPAATAALVRGDVDAVAGWEPWTSQTVVDGFGDIPFDYVDNPVGGLNGALQVHPDNLGEPKIAAFVACMVEAAELLNNDKDTHVAAMRDWSGISLPVAEHAHGRFIYDTNIYQANTEAYADFMFESGLIRDDVTDDVASVIDYSLLEEATELSADELGRGANAPDPRTESSQ